MTEPLQPFGAIAPGAKGGQLVGRFVDAQGNPLNMEARVASGRALTREIMLGLPKESTGGNPLNYVPSRDPSLPGFVVGAADDLAAKMSKEREGRWSIDAQIVLSRKRRLRMFGAALFGPRWKPLDEGIKTMSELLSWQRQQTQALSRHVISRRFVLCEEDAMVHGKTDHRCLEFEPHEKARARAYWDEAGVNVNGALRALDDLLRYSDATNGAVSGSVLIRLIALEGVAIIFNSENLDNEDDRTFIGRWIQDIVDLTKGDNRMLQYDVKAREFYRIPADRDEDPRTFGQAMQDADR